VVRPVPDALDSTRRAAVCPAGQSPPHTRGGAGPFCRTASRRPNAPPMC